MVPTANIQIDRRLAEIDPEEELESLRRGLCSSPRRLSAKYFYDDHGSRLFEEITTLDEYYQTRTERSLLARVASELIEHTEAEELVELGSGAANKTRVLLDAMARAMTLRLYVPFDVSAGILERTARELTARYPGLHVHGVVGDFLHHLGAIPEGGRRLVVFLGGTIGNLERRTEALRFLERLADGMDPGDYFLLGVDLVKDPAVLLRAYDDQRGVTAEFNRNILRVTNQLFGTNFEPDLYRHKAVWNAGAERIEMWLLSERVQTVHLPVAETVLYLAEGEALLTEISCKYDQEGTLALLDAAGFESAGWWSDDQDLFALALGRRRS